MTLIPSCAYVFSCFNHVWFFVTLWTIACLAPLSMGKRSLEWLPCSPPGDLPNPPPGDLPNPRIEPTPPEYPILQADPLLAEPPGNPYSILRHMQILFVGNATYQQHFLFLGSSNKWNFPCQTSYISKINVHVTVFWTMWPLQIYKALTVLRSGHGLGSVLKHIIILSSVSFYE